MPPGWAGTKHFASVSYGVISNSENQSSFNGIVNSSILTSNQVQNLKHYFIHPVYV